MGHQSVVVPHAHERDDWSSRIDRPARRPPGSPGAAELIVLRLQRSAGNAATTELLHGAVPAAAHLLSSVQRNGDEAESSTRPTREQRVKKRALDELEHGGIDGKTRGSKKRKEEWETLSGLSGAEATEAAEQRRRNAAPPKLLIDGRGIFKGNRGFSPQFMARFWELHTAKAQADALKAKAAAGKGDDDAAEVLPLCARCTKEITPAERSIDHKKPWSILKTECATTVVCKAGTHWEVVLRDVALRKSWNGPLDVSKFTQISDRPNLQPMHVVCNSGKNGSKEMDAITPKRLGPCPDGADCALPKAR